MILGLGVLLAVPESQGVRKLPGRVAGELQLSKMRLKEATRPVTPYAKAETSERLGCRHSRISWMEEVTIGVRYSG